MSAVPDAFQQPADRARTIDDPLEARAEGPVETRRQSASEAIRSRAYDEEATRAHALETCNRKFAALRPATRVEWALEHLPSAHVLSSSFGAQARRLDRMTAAAAGRFVIGEIERIRPAARARLECIGLKSWGGDPYACGAWAYFRPGQNRAYAAAMGRAHGRLHFCGEHLGRSARGIEGALESAETAAASVSGRK